jgi:uncharacterized protein with NRDE domain
MCLIALAWRAHPRFSLVVAANRDEFHARPAAPAGFWSDLPSILAGRDLEAMGTWMGVARDGRFSAVTNYRGAREPRAKESRGSLVTGFLTDGAGPREFVAGVVQRAAEYSGFNLLAADGDELWWFSNRGDGARRLEPGIYALGNELIDAPDTVPVRQQFARLLEGSFSIESLFEVLAPARIVSPAYGTRCSTVLLRGSAGRVQFAERSFDSAGTEGETLRYEFSLA